MESRLASGVLIARGEGAWRVLLHNAAAAEGSPAQTPRWTLPQAPLQIGQSADAVVARLMTRECGKRLLPTEFLQLGWYHNSTSAVQGHTVSVLFTIIPDTYQVGATMESVSSWWPLQAVLNHNQAPQIAPFTWQIVRDAAHLTPSDAMHKPTVVAAADRHVPSMLSLLHSVRERTGGVTPEVWNLDLMDVETSHRAQGGDFLVATLNNFVVAMVGVRPVTRTCAELAWLMVHPRWRSRGIGQHMVHVAERRAAELGFRTLALDAAYLHGPGQALFRRAGYTRDESILQGNVTHFGAAKQLHPTQMTAVTGQS